MRPEVRIPYSMHVLTDVVDLPLIVSSPSMFNCADLEFGLHPRQPVPLRMPSALPAVGSKA